MHPLYGRALLEWPLVLVALTVFGTGAFALCCAPSDDAHGEAVVSALSPLWRGLALVAVLILPLVLLDITAEMAAVSWGKAIPLMPAVMLHTHVGRVWAGCLPATGLLLAGAFLPRWHAVRPIVLSALATLLLLCDALSSHAVDQGWLAVAVYFIHESAAGLWLGALLGLWIVAKRGKAPKRWAEHAARRVSYLASWCVLALVLTGAYTAYETLGLNLSGLLFSTYGRILIAKVVIFATVLALGAYNRYRLVPEVKTSTSREALLRNVGVESLILLVGVLALASLLANTPPAHNHIEHSARTAWREYHHHESSTKLSAQFAAVRRTRDQEKGKRTDDSTLSGKTKNQVGNHL
ncbi:MAG TPA: CopD family protein [Candidatus Binatia bacterium]|nr:CopD family protein [Candidatus Binatia bacterium]